MATSSSKARRRGPDRRQGAGARGERRRPPAALVAPPPVRAPEIPPARRSEPRIVPLAPLAAPAAIGVIGVVLLAAGLVVLGLVLVVLGAALVVASVLLGSPARLAERVGGRPAAQGEDERLLNLAEGLCVASGLAVPEVRILDDKAANALLLSSPSRGGILVVTSGLLELLERIELEGVLAHELSHLRRGDVARAAAATRGAGLLARVWAGTPLLVLRLAGRERESRADLAAAALTRYPPGLAAALDKLADVATRPAGLDLATARLTAPLWCAPLVEGVPRQPVAGALSLSERAALLNEL